MTGYFYQSHAIDRHRLRFSTLPSGFASNYILRRPIERNFPRFINAILLQVLEISPTIWVDKNNSDVIFTNFRKEGYGNGIRSSGSSPVVGFIYNSTLG